ncbi:MAG: MATE family efflux transporter [Lachnospiraceae bacterium]|nr:MATE family efflux transporter [Lachnospiraceae bacterium]
MATLNSASARQYSAKTNAQAFWGLFPALVVSNFIPALASIVNGLIVGNAYSPVSMAAVSFVTPVSKCIGAIAIIFSSGGGILYGRYLGRGQGEDVHKVFTSGLIGIAIISALLTLAGEIFTPQIVTLIGVSGESFTETVVYLRGLFVGVFPTILMPSLVTFLNLGNEAKYGMLSSLVLAAGNLVFGLLNVHLFKGGMFGIGLASAFSQYLATAFLMMKFFKRPEIGHLVKCSTIPNELKTIVLFGIPAASLELAASIRNMVINAQTLATGGTLAVAGLGIVLSSAGFFCAGTAALVSASATLVSISVGEEDKTSLCNLVRYLLKTGAVIVLTEEVLYFVSAPVLATLFGAEGQEVHYAIMCIRLYSFEFLTIWFAFILMGTYQSLGRTGLATFLQIMLNFVFAITVVFIAVNVLPDDIKVYGVWSCYAIAAAMGSLLIIIIAWIKNKRFPTSVEDLLWIEPSFGVSDENRIVISVDSIDDVVTVAETVQKFLKDRGIDSGRSMKSAICLEEMAGNIVEHGFTKKKSQKNLAIDIYVAVKDDKVRIRLHDNAPQFDPFMKLEMYKENEDDPCRNIGIRMTGRLAKEMKYQTTLGMNVLSIEM